MRIVRNQRSFWQQVASLARVDGQMLNYTVAPPRCTCSSASIRL